MEFSNSIPLKKIDTYNQPIIGYLHITTACLQFTFHGLVIFFIPGYTQPKQNVVDLTDMSYGDGSMTRFCHWRNNVKIS